MTQMDLAKKADLSLDTIKSIEAGKRGMTLERFLKLAEAFQVYLSFLIYKKIEEVSYIVRFQKINNSKLTKVN